MGLATFWTISVLFLWAFQDAFLGVGGQQQANFASVQQQPRTYAEPTSPYMSPAYNPYNYGQQQYYPQQVSQLNEPTSQQTPFSGQQFPINPYYPRNGPNSPYNPQGQSNVPTIYMGGSGGFASPQEQPYRPYSNQYPPPAMPPPVLVFGSSNNGPVMQQLPPPMSMPQPPVPQGPFMPPTWQNLQRPGPIIQLPPPQSQSQGAFPVNHQSFAKNFCLTPGCIEAAAHLLSKINASMDPCEDFYQFACGKWMAQTPIPEEKTEVDMFTFITERVQNRLKTQLEASDPLSIGPSRAVDAARKYYKTCTDLDALAKMKSKPLYDALTALGSWPLLGSSSGTFNLTKTVATMESKYTINPLWNLEAAADAKDATRRVLRFDQPDLNLDAKDVYVDGSAHSNEILKAYQKRIEQSADLIAKDAGLSVSMTDIRAQAEKIVEFEKKLASLTKKEEERRNHSLQNNLWTLQELKENVKAINWDAYFDALLPAEVRPLFRNDQARVQIAEPKYIKDLNDLLISTDPKTLANFIIWNLVWAGTSTLDERFLDISLEFNRIAYGQQKRPPKSKICMDNLTNQMKHATGAIYIDKQFGDADKAEANALIENLVASLESMIKETKWMDQPTKQAAVKKLHNISPLIGFPDFIKTSAQLDDYYKDLFLQPTDSNFEMQVKMAAFEQRLELRKLLKTVDRSEFEMSPGKVNAYYNPEMNTIGFPAAILQPYFFRGDFPKAFNYGAIGFIIGHELTHGFDDEGSQYDEVGNLRNWWSNQSADSFAAKTKCMVDQYSSYRIDAINMTVKGELTIGENIADNGGLKEAFMAYKRYRAIRGEEPLLPGLNLSNDQVFFTAFASVWCNKIKPQELMRRTMGDPHSPSEIRVIGTVSNSDDFARAFNCRAGSRMNPVKSDKTKCEVW